MCKSQVIHVNITLNCTESHVIQVNITLKFFVHLSLSWTRVAHDYMILQNQIFYAGVGVSKVSQQNRTKQISKKI